MEWTNDLIFEFLSLYEKEPALWNSAVPEHKNRNDAYDAWRRIQSSLKGGAMPINELKKKRDNLMSSYRRLAMKVTKTLEAGEEAFKPDWPFYSTIDSFLGRVYKPRKRKNSEDSQEAEEVDEETFLDDEVERECDLSFKVPKITYTKITKKSKLNDETNHVDETYEEPREVPKRESDICAMYCDLLCVKLRSLKENTRDIAMMEIDRIIYNLKHQDSTMGSQYGDRIPSILQQSSCDQAPTASGLHSPLHSSQYSPQHHDTESFESKVVIDTQNML